MTDGPDVRSGRVDGYVGGRVGGHVGGRVDGRTPTPGANKVSHGAGRARSWPAWRPRPLQPRHRPPGRERRGGLRRSRAKPLIQVNATARGYGF